jgi:hypothetical protein
MAVSDITVIIESWLKDNTLPNAFSSCAAFTANAPLTRKFIGGVAVIIEPSSSVSAYQMLNVATDMFQCIAVKINKYSYPPFNLVALYASPSLTLNNMKSLLSQNLQAIVHNDQDDTLIVGDFNADATKFTVLDIPQFVTSSTHINGAILDHVYWSGDADSIKTDVIACYWSDHNIVTVSLGIDTLPQQRDHVLPYAAASPQPHTVSSQTTSTASLPIAASTSSTDAILLPSFQASPSTIAPRRTLSLYATFSMMHWVLIEFNLTSMFQLKMYWLNIISEFFVLVVMVIVCYNHGLPLHTRLWITLNN